MSKYLKFLQRLFFIAWYFPLFKFLRKYRRKSKNVVMLFPDYPTQLKAYIYSQRIISDFGLVAALLDQCDDLRIVFGRRNADSVKDSNLFFTISKSLVEDASENYCHFQLDFVDKMVAQRNFVMPNRENVEWWENKVFMHREFENLDIKTPETMVFQLGKPDQKIEFTPPFLVKEVHSCGANGVHKVNSMQEFQDLLALLEKETDGSSILIQRLLKIDRDLRVALVGDEIFYHHWRFNDTANWEPTTYKKGKRGDFDNFPEQWREHIIEQFRKTGLITGAFDMAWENNDLSEAPYIFEISPAFYPNPKPPTGLNKPYGNYMHEFQLFNSWDKKFVQRSFELRKLIASEYVRRSQKTQSSGNKIASQTSCGEH